MAVLLLRQLSGQSVLQDFGSQVLEPPIALFVIDWQRFILWRDQVWLDLVICAVFCASSAFWICRWASLLIISVQLLHYAVFVKFMTTFEHDERFHARCLALVLAETHSHALILVIGSTQIESEDA